MRGAEDTRTAIAVAERQANIAEDTAKRQLRAYLAVTDVKPRSVAPDSLTVNATVINKGSTPARVGAITGRIWVGPLNELDPAANGPATTAYFSLRNWFPHGWEEPLMLWTDANSGSVANAGNPNYETYVYGRIEYRDIFDEPHWVTFAYRVKGAGFDMTCEFMPCVHGNEGN